METKMSFFQSWDDVVFENRNRSYGAYVIRKHYSRRVLLGSGVTIALLALLLVFAERSIEAPAIVPPFIPEDKGGLTFLPDPPRRPLREPKPRSRETTRRDNTQVRIVSTPVEMEPLVDSLLFNEPEGEIDGDGSPDGDESGVETGGIGLAVADDDTPVIAAEVMPEFPGGYKEMMKFIKRNIRFPRSAKNLDTSGTVYVSFVIDGNGQVTDVSVLRGFHPACDKEAVRVISILPEWRGGKQNGRPVRVKMVLPITFDVL